MDMGWIKTDEIVVSSGNFKNANPKNPVFKPFYLCIICYQHKKRPYNHIFYGYKVFLLCFMNDSACVWAVDPEKGHLGTGQ